MEISAEQSQDTYHLTLCGRFTFEDNEKFRKALNSAEQAGCGHITVNLEGLEYIDSSGLGMLLLLREIGDTLSARIELCHAKGQPLKLFEISKFGTLFDMHP